MVDVTRFLADDDAELDFPIGLLRAARDDDVIVRPANGTRRLEEENGFGGDFHAGFGCVIGIVEADADELADLADARTDARCGGDERQRSGIEALQPRKRFWRKGCAVDVGHMSGEIADIPISIEKARLFRARLSISQEFHVLLQPPSMVRILPVMKPAAS